MYSIYICALYSRRFFTVECNWINRYVDACEYLRCYVYPLLHFTCLFIFNFVSFFCGASWFERIRENNRITKPKKKNKQTHTHNRKKRLVFVRMKWQQICKLCSVARPGLYWSTLYDYLCVCIVYRTRAWPNAIWIVYAVVSCRYLCVAASSSSSSNSIEFNSYVNCMYILCVRMMRLRSNYTLKIKLSVI